MSDVNQSVAPRAFANFKKRRENTRNDNKVKSQLEFVKYLISVFRPSDVTILGKDDIIEYSGFLGAAVIAASSLVWGGITLGAATASFSSLGWVTASSFAAAWTVLGVIGIIIGVVVLIWSVWQIFKDVKVQTDFPDITNVNSLTTYNSNWDTIYNTPTNTDVGPYLYRDHVSVYLLNDTETYADNHYTYSSLNKRYVIEDMLFLNRGISRDSYNVSLGNTDIMRMLALRKNSLSTDNTFYAGLKISGAVMNTDTKVIHKLSESVGYKLYMSFYIPELIPFIKIKNVGLTGKYSGCTRYTPQTSDNQPDLEVSVEDFRYGAGITTSFMYNTASYKSFITDILYNQIHTELNSTTVGKNIESPYHDLFNFYDYYTGYTTLSHNTIPEIYDDDTIMKNDIIHSLSSFPIWMGRMTRTGWALSFNSNDYLENYEYRKRHINDCKVPIHASIYGYDNILKLALGGIAANSLFGNKRIKFAFGINPLLAYDDAGFVSGMDNDSSPWNWYKPGGKYWTPYQSRVARYRLDKKDIEDFRFSYEFDYVPFLLAEVEGYIPESELYQGNDTLEGLTFKVTNKGNASTNGSVNIRILSYNHYYTQHNPLSGSVGILVFHSSSDFVDPAYYTSAGTTNLADDKYRLGRGSYEVIYETTYTFTESGGEVISDNNGPEWSMNGVNIPFIKTDGTYPSTGYRSIVLQVDPDIEQEEHMWIQGYDPIVSDLNSSPSGPDNSHIGMTTIPTRTYKDSSDEQIGSSVASVDDVGYYKRQNYASTTALIRVLGTGDLHINNVTLSEEYIDSFIVKGQDVQFQYNYVNKGDAYISAHGWTAGSGVEVGVLFKHYISSTPILNSNSIHYPTLDYWNASTLYKDVEYSKTIDLSLPTSLSGKILYFIVEANVNPSMPVGSVPYTVTEYTTVPIASSRRSNVIFID